MLLDYRLLYRPPFLNSAGLFLAQKLNDLLSHDVLVLVMQISNGSLHFANDELLPDDGSNQFFNHGVLPHVHLKAENR